MLSVQWWYKRELAEKTIIIMLTAIYIYMHIHVLLFNTDTNFIYYTAVCCESQMFLLTSSVNSLSSFLPAAIVFTFFNDEPAAVAQNLK